MQLLEDRWTLFSNLTALQLNSTLLIRSEKLHSLLSQLTRLELTDGNVLLGDVKLTSLQHLTITNRCTAHLLERILTASINLKSFQARISQEEPLSLKQSLLTLKHLILDMSG